MFSLWGTLKTFANLGTTGGMGAVCLLVLGYVSVWHLQIQSLCLRMSPFSLLQQDLFMVLNIPRVTLLVSGETSKFFLGDRKCGWRVSLYRSRGGRS